METNEKIDVESAAVLDVLRAQPARDPVKAAHGRELFLAQAQEMVIAPEKAVSPVKNLRHIWWKHFQSLIFPQSTKEHSPMFGTLGTILLVITLVLGGGGATVAAAQQSMPDEALYPVKTWSEDLRMNVTQNEQTRFALALEFADRRGEEVMEMIREGEVPPEAVQARLREELTLALELAAGQDDAAMVRMLTRVRDQIVEQEQEFTQLGPQMGGQTGAVFERTMSMLHERLQLCEDGIEDPEQLREKLQDRNQLQQHTPDPDRTPQMTGVPKRTGTPTPGSGYGPGPGGQNEEGVHPWIAGTATPGSGYGPGEGGYGDPGGNDDPGGNGDPGGNDDPGGNGDPGGNDETGGNGDPGGNDETGGNDDSGGNDETGSGDSGGGDDSGGSGDSGGGGDTGGSGDTGGDSSSGGDGGSGGKK